ncbi:MAG: hypothetical protein JWM85_3173 [Acidimicrobiaceae bacterium]|nr:hypothetical protein [Acidimicrobiaceae bacterium]
MRFMMFMFPNISEDDWMPDPEAVAAMTRYNEELTEAGVLLSLDGLASTANGARVSSSGGQITVTDGPFAEAKEIIGGFWMIRVGSKEEAVEWAKRCPAISGPAQDPAFAGTAPMIEVRQVFEMSDFPPEVQAAAEQARS